MWGGQGTADGVNGCLGCGWGGGRRGIGFGVGRAQQMASINSGLADWLTAFSVEFIYRTCS
jgi:hypothetical protein